MRQLPLNVQFAIASVMVGTGGMFWALWSATHGSFFPDNDIKGGIMMWGLGWLFAIIAWTSGNGEASEKDI